MASIQWIPETEAAQKVGRKPRTLRKLVKSGAWKCLYTAPNGRSFFYSEKDLDKVLNQFSTRRTA